MAWNRRGLKAMSTLRAYICSGGKVTSEQVKQKHQEDDNADRRLVVRLKTLRMWTVKLKETNGYVLE